jgi:chromosome segregation ATPase
MLRALQIASLIVLAAITFAFLELGLAIRQEAKRLDATLADVSRFTQSATGVTADLRKIADSVKRQSDAQASALTETTRNLSRVTLTLNSDLEKLGPVIDSARAALIEQNKALTMLGQQASLTLDDARDAIADLKPALQAATDTLRGTAKLTNDPDWEALLSHASDTTAHLDATAASVDRDAQMLETRLRQALKPASFAKRIFMGLLGLAGPAAQVATAAK